MRPWLAVPLALAALASPAPCIGAVAPGLWEPHTQLISIRYTAHNGDPRVAVVLLPSWYTPGNDPPLPLVISPHGRGIGALANARFWGDLPGLDGFAVVNPQGQGRKLELYSWGDPGQIADLARMPSIVGRALPWVHVKRRSVYAVGGSMGGQETLLLVALHPQLLAGAIAFDAPTDLEVRYRDFPDIRFGVHLQRLARYEIGGTPRQDLRAWERRSPIDYARRIADSGVPLEIWWSRYDRTVRDGWDQSGLLYRDIRRDNPAAPVVQHVGRWQHCYEMRWTSRLPQALAWLGLGTID